MFNSTTLKLRRTGRTRRPERLFIFLLSLLCFSNSFCMEKENLNKIESNNNKQQIAFNILLLPDEILLPIIKFCIVYAADEEKLVQALSNLSLVNRRFKQLAHDKQAILAGFRRLADFKDEFYKSKIGWGIPIVDYENFIKISKENLISKIKEFKNLRNPRPIKTLSKIMEKKPENSLMQKSGRVVLTMVEWCIAAKLCFLAVKVLTNTK